MSSLVVFLEKLDMTEGQIQKIVISKQFCLLTMGTDLDFAENDTTYFLITLI